MSESRTRNATYSDSPGKPGRVHLKGGKVKRENPNIIVALDVASLPECDALASRLDPDWCRVKVGKELFTACGPAVVERLQNKGFDVFLDLKFHDIPATVEKAVKAAADLGVWMVNVHASGGLQMLEGASNALQKARQRPLLIGVTVLTSMSQQALSETGVSGTLPDQVARLSRLAYQSGCDGVVCSAQEAPGLRREFGSEFTLVTPGIRPTGSDRQDQTRTMTPQQAIRAGSDYLVIGRPVTGSEDPAMACQLIYQSLTAG